MRRPADATQLVDDEVGGPLIRGSANAIKAVTGAQAGYSDVEVSVAMKNLLVGSQTEYVHSP